MAAGDDVIAPIGSWLPALEGVRKPLSFIRTLLRDKQLDIGPVSLRTKGVLRPRIEMHGDDLLVTFALGELQMKAPVFPEREVMAIRISDTKLYISIRGFVDGELDVNS